MKDALWIITGTDPVIWAVPFWVKCEKDWHYIWPAMKLTHYQRVAVEKRIGENVTKVEEAGSFRLRVSLTHLSRVGEPVKNQVKHPEALFVWERVRDKSARPCDVVRRVDKDSFLGRLYLRGVGRSMGEVEWWWNQFSNNLLWWLVNRETPVDFYFFKIHPLPYKLNWHYELKNAFNPYDRQLFTADEAGAVMRGIELEIGPTWWRVSRRVEQDRVKMLGPYDYAEEIMAWTQRSAETLRTLSALWVEYRHQQRTRFVPGNCGNRYRFTPDNRKGCSKPAKSIAQAERQRQARKMAELRRIQIGKARHMRAMRRLQRKAKNMRVARDWIQRIQRGSDGKFKPQGLGAGGVPVLHADKNGHEESNLLAAGPGD